VIENVSRADQKIHRMNVAQLAQGLGTPHGPVLVMIGEAMRPRAHQQFDNGISGTIATQLSA